MSDATDPVRVAEAEVERALKHLTEANAQYIKAQRRLFVAKLERARDNPHPWFKMAVYRVIKVEGLRNRIEHGVVYFKDQDTPDYGNPHIPVGSYYVLVDGSKAKTLSADWELELL